MNTSALNSPGRILFVTLSFKLWVFKIGFTGNKAYGWNIARADLGRAEPTQVAMLPDWQVAGPFLGTSLPGQAGISRNLKSL